MNIAFKKKPNGGLWDLLLLLQWLLLLIKANAERVGYAINTMISDCRERGRVMVSTVASQEESLRFVPAGDWGFFCVVFVCFCCTSVGSL